MSSVPIICQIYSGTQFIYLKDILWNKISLVIRHVLSNDEVVWIVINAKCWAFKPQKNQMDKCFVGTLPRNMGVCCILHEKQLFVHVLKCKCMSLHHVVWYSNLKHIVFLFFFSWSNDFCYWQWWSNYLCNSPPKSYCLFHLVKFHQHNLKHSNFIVFVLDFLCNLWYGWQIQKKWFRHIWSNFLICKYLDIINWEYRIFIR